MKFLDGFKTIIGLVGTALAIVVPHVAPQVQESIPHVIGIAQGAFGLLTVLGVIHKVEKANDGQ